MGPQLEPHVDIFVPAAAPTPVRGSRRKNFIVEFLGQARTRYVAMESPDSFSEVMGEVNRT